MKKAAKIVLDTSIFVNPDARHFFGKAPDDAFNNFLNTIKDKKHISCYMPPAVYDELSKFMEKPIPANKIILINKKPPAAYKTSVSALFMYEFIEETRQRTNKGLRIAEKYYRKIPCPKDKREDPEIKNLREEYRGAVREGIVDSKEDFDLILLAYELDAYLATCDQGLIKWAQKLGISCLSAEELSAIICAGDNP